MICEDPRQWVPDEGQQWTTLEELAADHTAEVKEDHGVLGIGCTPGFAIGQRALVVDGVLWDCVPLLDGMAEGAGDLRAIAVSHPHYYTTMVEWSHAFGGIPIHVHADDREWVVRPDPEVEYWEGEELDLGGGLTLLRLGGHFAGGQVLHAGDRLLAGDIVHPAADRNWVSFMWSYPNMIPLSAATVRRMVEKLEPYEFDRLYGAWWGKVVDGDAKEKVRRSADRYVRALEGQPSPSQ